MYHAGQRWPTGDCGNAVFVRGRCLSERQGPLRRRALLRMLHVTGDKPCTLTLECFGSMFRVAIAGDAVGRTCTGIIRTCTLTDWRTGCSARPDTAITRKTSERWNMNREKSRYANRYHRDGTVTFWDVHAQQWERWQARDMVVSTEIMGSMLPEERNRIELMARKVTA